MNVPIDPQHDYHGKWMALVAALLGWMFDGFEIGLFPLVGPAAIDELLNLRRRRRRTQTGMVRSDYGRILIGAATGGVLFGWLGDKIGRVRAMSLSILTYAHFYWFVRVR